MKKLLFIEIVILILCSVFAYTAYDKYRFFAVEAEQKKQILRQEKEKLEQMDGEYGRLVYRLEELRSEESSRQLDLWKRRLKTLEEALH
ncbi:MAG: hypothetical protein IJI44_03070 [Erysipelotrichaceae bacterium]|nr:hypothetical protein [Erysipelotrichaceae bacterium]